MRHALSIHRFVRLRRRLLAAVAALAVAACASPSPAPIVQRTTPGAGAARPATPTPPPLPPVAAPAATPAPVDAPVVETVPIRPGAIESRGIESRPLDARPLPPGAAPAPVAPAAPALPPNTRTAPRGTKLPWSDAALAELRAADAAPAASGPPAAAGASAAAAAAAASGAPTASGPSAGAPTAGKSTDGRPAESAADTKAAAAADGDWAWPTGGRVIQTFGESGNKGIVLGGKIGDPVLAASDGKVIFGGNGPRGYGNLVIVKHANDLLSVYAHNRTLAVKEGQTVKRGQKIAELGDSGTTSPRLHFEIRQQGRPVDPVRFLPKR